MICTGFDSKIGIGGLEMGVKKIISISIKVVRSMNLVLSP